MFVAFSYFVPEGLVVSIATTSAVQLAYVVALRNKTARRILGLPENNVAPLTLMPKKAPANPPLRFINEIDAKLETENAQRRTVDALPTTAATNNVAEMRNAKRSKKRGGKRRK